MASRALTGLRGGHVDTNNTRNPNSRKSRPQLDYSQAMKDFKGMFPDMVAEVIEAILKSNNGAVNATMYQLLTMSADNEYEKLLHDPIDGTTSRNGKEHHHPDCTGNPASYQQATKGIPE